MYLDSDIKKTKENHSDIPQLSHYLNGKIQYMRMIKGNSDDTYKTLRNKFIYLYIPQWKEWEKNILDFCDAVQNSKLSIEELNKWYKTISTNINIHLLKDTPLYTSLTKALSCLTLKASDIPTQTVFKEPIHNATLLPSFYMRISAKTIRSNLSLISGTEMRTIANLKGMRILSERNKWHLKR